VEEVYNDQKLIKEDEENFCSRASVEEITKDEKPKKLLWF